MPKRSAKANEKRFRRGALLLFAVALMSAGSTAALYAGIKLPFLYSTALALPVVVDIALQTFFAGWILLEKVRYYWFLGATGMAAIFAAVSILCMGISFSGRAFQQSFAGRGIKKVFSAFGVAQLLSARALSALALLLYLADAAISLALVLASPQTFTPYYLFLMANLLIHFFVLSFLGYSFSASIGGKGDQLQE